MAAQKRKGCQDYSSLWSMFCPFKVSVQGQTQQETCSPLSEHQAHGGDVRLNSVPVMKPALCLGPKNLPQIARVPSVHAPYVQPEADEVSFLNCRYASLCELSTAETSLGTDYSNRPGSLGLNADEPVTLALSIAEELYTSQKPLRIAREVALQHQPSRQLRPLLMQRYLSRLISMLSYWVRDLHRTLGAETWKQDCKWKV